jgi:hypothetical protein
MTNGHLLFRTHGIDEIAKERRDQIEKHGKTPIIDFLDNADNKGLTNGALFLITLEDEHFPKHWLPESKNKFKGKGYVERLAIAGSFLAAQIDLYRMSPEDVDKLSAGAADTIEAVARKVAHFSDRTFGADRLYTGPLYHIKDEVDECIKANGSIHEFADIFNLLLDAYRKAHGFDFTPLFRASVQKINECHRREWGKPDGRGVIHHIEPAASVQFEGVAVRRPGVLSPRPEAITENAR